MTIVGATQDAMFKTFRQRVDLKDFDYQEYQDQ